jgi:hypothetical protein
MRVVPLNQFGMSLSRPVAGGDGIATERSSIGFWVGFPDWCEKRLTDP